MNESKQLFPLTYAISKKRRGIFDFTRGYRPTLIWIESKERFEVLGLSFHNWGIAAKTGFKRQNQDRPCWWTKNPNKAAILMRYADKETNEVIERKLKETLDNGVES